MHFKFNADDYFAHKQMGSDEEEERAQQSEAAAAGVSESDDGDVPSTCPNTETDPRGNETGSSSLNQSEIFKALEVVEKDSVAIAESFSSLFASLRLALSEATGSSVDHMRCFSDAAGSLQETVLDAATKGNKYINSCLRLNEEMKGVDKLATKLKVLRRNVDALNNAVNKLVRLP